MRKYIIRFLLSVVFLFLIASVAFNRINNFLEDKKRDIENAVSSYLNCQAKIDDIKYIFPASLRINNFHILQNNYFKKKQVLYFKKVKLTFSILAVASRSNAFISRVNVEDASFDYAECFSLAKEHYADIVSFISSLPKDAVFSLLFKEASLTFSSKDSCSLSFGLKIKRGTFFSCGLIKIGPLKEHGLNLWRYNLKGYLTNEGLAIDNLEIRRKNFYSLIRGVAEDNALRFNGFLSLSSHWKELAENFEDFNIPHALNSLIKRKKTEYEYIIRNTISGLNLYELSATVKFNLPQIDIERSRFILNNVPISLQGKVVFGPKISVDASANSYPDKSPDERQKNPLSFDLSIMGRLEKSEFNGEMGLNFSRNIKNKIVQQKLNLRLSDAYFDLSCPEYLKIDAGEMKTEYHSGENQHKILLRDANILFFVKDNFLRLVNLNCKVYDGNLSGTGQINLANMPPKCDFNFLISNAGAGKFKDLLEYFSKVEGTLESSIRYKNYPYSTLSGRMDISNGYLNNFEFFKWLADFFVLPSLRRIDFDKVSFDFFVNGDAAKMENIKLVAKDVAAGGYFGIYSGDLVKSAVSLTLSKDIVNQSEKLKPLIRLLRENFTSLDFDFQLSGIFKAMNFQWLKSDFKNKVQDALPGFIERGIERKVEEAIEAIGEE
ncbi:MAG: AsmA-like C-terminal region-containing protein [Candidatus Omnitrophota bacterium]